MVGIVVSPDQTCFGCGRVLAIPSKARSTMCKSCSAHIDLQDHVIQNSVSKNFRTKGRLVIEESGFLLTCESLWRRVRQFLGAGEGG